jgi:hypothetical protein
VQSFCELSDAIQQGRIQIIFNDLLDNELFISVIANNKERRLRTAYSCGPYLLTALIIWYAFFFNHFAFAGLGVLAVSFFTSSRYFPFQRAIFLFICVVFFLSLFNPSLFSLLTLQYILNYFLMGKARSLTRKIILNACEKIESAFIVCYYFQVIYLLDLKTGERYTVEER